MTRKQQSKEEMMAQAEAFRRMKGDDMNLISRYAADFRRIITEYESCHNGQPPSADDLLWIKSEHEGRDITEE